jgi:hypothetical protein
MRELASPFPGRRTAVRNVTGSGILPSPHAAAFGSAYLTFDLTFDGARRFELVRLLDAFFAAADRFAGRLAFFVAIPFHPLRGARVVFTSRS